jgi:peptidoglycan/xylan/chitin deacetylase (PgdA/CDA1 family)
MADRRITNLCFHGIGTPQRELEPGEAPYWISEDLFAVALDLAAGRPDVRLSFDDGNASDVDIALPALRTRGMSAAFFPIAQRIGVPGSTDQDGLRELVREGMTIGSHGMRHVPWRTVNNAELDRELVDAREIIADSAGTTVNEAACPLGSYDRRVLRWLRRLDYRRVFTSDRVRTRPQAWLQPRFSVLGADTPDKVRATLDSPTALRDEARAEARVALKRLR